MLSSCAPTSFRTHITQKNRQKEESMESTKNDNEEVHSEIIQFKKSRISKGQNNNSQQLGENNTNKNWWSHNFKGLLSSILPCAISIHKGNNNVDTEFNRESYSYDEVDNRDSIDLDGEAREDKVGEIAKTNDVERGAEDCYVGEEGTPGILEEHHDEVDYAGSDQQVGDG